MVLNDRSPILFCAIIFFAIQICQQVWHKPAGAHGTHLDRPWPCADSHLPHVTVRGSDANDALSTVVDETYRRRVISDLLLATGLRT
jgi:hypothetical protein